MAISPRLSKIVDMIEPCGMLADIGCDHGYVCIEALLRGKAQYAVAADIAEGPLSAAAKNAKSAGVTDKISFILSDGFKSFPEDVRPDCIVIAGMGGELIKSILCGGSRYINGAVQLILGVQSEPEKVRRFIIDGTELYISRECYVKDSGKYYVLLDIRNTGNRSAKGCSPEDRTAAYTEVEYLYGKYIDRDSVGVYTEFLSRRKESIRLALKNASAGDSPNSRIKAAELARELHYIEKALGQS